MQKVCKETESALKRAADNMKRFYNRKHKFEEFTEVLWNGTSFLYNQNLKRE